MCHDNPPPLKWTPNIHPDEQRRSSTFGPLVMALTLVAGLAAFQYARQDRPRSETELRIDADHVDQCSNLGGGPVFDKEYRYIGCAFPAVVHKAL